MTREEIKSVALEAIRAEAAAVAQSREAVDERFVDAVAAIAACGGHVAVIGLGKSGIIGRKIAATLASTGTPALFVHATEALHGDLGMIASGDVALALSYSGESDELNRILPPLRRRHIPVIGVSSSDKSALATAATTHIALPRLPEACPNNLAPTSSTAAMLAVGDALAVCLMHLRGFGREDYARLHPGGMLGRLLTCSVEDIMQRGERNPTAPLTATVEDALLVMTRTRSGAASIVEADGALAGFFTDGDLRRHLQADPLLLQKNIAEVMTRQPTFLRADMKAAEAADILCRQKVDNAPVVDERGRVVGIVDQGDLLPFLTT
ncbi:MAG: KpsF/GutQ family sugar-phosphate isomerase [Prevotellaceae bacterium]|jgi:arabinose-5-phosphate isomerase|nr:KpsF/GutQ family sugar-phosphate isomerase [Prevotellaceae bacterium]